MVNGQGADGADVYRGLREQILGLDPAEAGITAAPESGLWGGLMEMGLDNGTATLVALADGTTSLYFSTGGGVIGGGFRPPVAEATRSFLASLDAHLADLVPDASTELPAAGRTALVALTRGGRLRAEAAEDDLGYGRHPLSPVFLAAHDVITELRILQESRED